MTCSTCQPQSEPAHDPLDPDHGRLCFSDVRARAAMCFGCPWRSPRRPGLAAWAWRVIRGAKRPRTNTITCTINGRSLDPGALASSTETCPAGRWPRADDGKVRWLGRLHRGVPYLIRVRIAFEAGVYAYRRSMQAWNGCGCDDEAKRLVERLTERPAALPTVCPFTRAVLRSV